MEKLPCVALVEVLGHLPYGDLIRFRLVNKLWRHLIDHSVSKRELILFVETKPCSNWWVHSGAAIKLANSVQANYSIFTSKTFFEIFKGVKRLFLSFNHLFFSRKLTNNLASNFGATLQHLQIDCQSNSSLDESTTFPLTLRNLQSFSFLEKTVRFEFHSKAFFSLDCDRLTHLYALSHLTLENNSMIAWLAPNLKVLAAKVINYTETLEFPNLEILSCSRAPETRFLATCLPKLKEFYFITNCFSADLIEAQHWIDEFLQGIEERQREVQVFWLGLKFTLENSDRLFDALVKTENPNGGAGMFDFTPKALNFFKENRSLINFHPIQYIDECWVKFSDSFGDQLDEQLDRELIENWKKDWHTVLIRSEFRRQFDVAKLSNLFQFVSRLSVSRILKQSEFDALPEIMPNLRILYMNRALTSKSLENLDLSFVPKFKNLFKFEMFAPLSLATLDRMLTDCPYLYFVSFTNEAKEIYVRIHSRHLVPVGRRFQLSFTPTASERFYFKGKENFLEFLDINDFVLKENERKRKRMKTVGKDELP